MSGLAHIPFSRMGGLIPALSFPWPGMLWFLLLVPLLVAGYIYLITRPSGRRFVIRAWRSSKRQDPTEVFGVISRLC